MSAFKIESDFLTLLQSAVFGRRCDLSGQSWEHERASDMLKLAGDQAVAGLIVQGLIDSGVRLERQDVLDVFETRQAIWQRNMELDAAVASLCSAMQKEGIRIWVVKGQTLALLYPEPRSRSCGDIDFLCHPDDWEKAINYVESILGHRVKDTSNPMHVEYHLGGIQYEMHRTLVMLSNPRHQRYWDDVVMEDIMASDSKVEICGTLIPTLPQTVNAAYIFVHIFGHFISEGIGLRQFCDWALVLLRYKDEIDHIRLSEYLDGIGLKKAYIGFGAILTDYLGFPEESFSFKIPENLHGRVVALWENILKQGNFGKNKRYIKQSGLVHALQHLQRIANQTVKFHYYAPSESWGKIPRMFLWWKDKIGILIKKKINK